MKNYDIVVIGAGPAGLSAALEARAGGAIVAVLDRLPAPGGILSQCLHRGFGREGMNGIEYSARLIEKAQAAGVEIHTDSTVTDISADRLLTVFSGLGVYRLRARAVVLATGARERPSGSLGLAGTRPSGVFTAGSVQRMLNLGGYTVGRRAVILGSGDVGMIVAHHLTLGGAEVLGIYERESMPSGLKRNRQLYVDSHGIPLITRATVTELHGAGRLEAVTVCSLDSIGEPIQETGRVVECDTLVTSVGLIPERELVAGLGDTRGRLPPWIFECGNARRIFSLVEAVAEDGAAAAKKALENR